MGFLTLRSPRGLDGEVLFIVVVVIVDGEDGMAMLVAGSVC